MPCTQTYRMRYTLWLPSGGFKNACPCPFPMQKCMPRVSGTRLPQAEGQGTPRKWGSREERSRSVSPGRRRTLGSGTITWWHGDKDFVWFSPHRGGHLGWPGPAPSPTHRLWGLHWLRMCNRKPAGKQKAWFWEQPAPREGDREKRRHFSSPSALERCVSELNALLRLVT